jgi:hypothetical protein
MALSLTEHGILAMKATIKKGTKAHPQTQANRNTEEGPTRSGWRLDGTWTPRLTEDELRANLRHACEQGFVPS